MTRHGLLWLFAIIIIFLFAPLLMSRSDYASCFESEFDAAKEGYGENEVNIIIARADRLYRGAMISTGIDPLIRKYWVKDVSKKEIVPGIRMPESASPYAEQLVDYWGNFLHNIWLFCFRIAHSWSWMAYLMPFIGAIIFDGLMARKAKLASFRYTSPTIYNLSWHAVIALAAFSLVAFSVVTPLSVFFYPAVITAMGIFTWLLISNIQHSA